MKLRCVLCVALAGALAGLALRALAEEGAKAPVTLKGTVVDLACYLEEGKLAGDHSECAKSCVKGGSPAGLVTEDGAVYVIVPHGKNGRAPLEHVGEAVEVTGVVHERGGARGITASECRRLEMGGGTGK